MTGRLATLAVVAAGCDEVLGEPSLVEDLRVLATATSPCAPLADNGAQLAVAVADPDQLGASVAAWACPTPATGAEAAPCWFARMDPVDGIGRAPFVVGSSADLWVAACDPAVCDLEALGQDEASLRDPASWLAELPLSGVSAATRPLTVRAGDADAGCTNPALRAQPDREALGSTVAGAEVPLRFEVAGAGLAYAWTTAGRFTAPEYGIAEDGSVVATWVAPEAPGLVQLFVVFVETAPSAFGAVQPTEGTAVWAATAAVR